MLKDLSRNLPTRHQSFESMRYLFKYPAHFRMRRATKQTTKQQTVHQVNKTKPRTIAKPTGMTDERKQTRSVHASSGVAVVSSGFATVVIIISPRNKVISISNG